METGAMRTYEIENGRLHVNGEAFPIRRSIVQAGLAVYGARTGRFLTSEGRRRFIPREAVDEILAIDRQSSLASLELSLEDAWATT
jgi:hypothetical protein